MKATHEVTEALWKLRQAILPLHPNATFELNFDEITHAILSDEMRRLPRQEIPYAVETGPARIIKAIFGHKIGVIKK